ncbi:MAG TPA: hypothetical protein VHE55_15330 [Fimbriimonadaceae bacterium]|nr:hypothetical protein [Fimbriimonadaceae bacterium]
MRFLTSFALVAGIAASAAAQIAPVHPIDSIDFTVQNASRVVTGNLLDYEKSPRDWQFRNAKIGVKETLKGQAAPQLDTKLRAPDATLAGWKESENLLLIAVDDGPNRNAAAIDLAAKNLAVITEDLKLLRSPDEILKWVRESIARTKDSQGHSGFELRVPPEMFKGTSLENVGIDYGLPRRALVRVPVDGKLFNRATEDVRSGGDEERRITGIQELRLFKTKASIDILTRLLRDESDWKLFEGVGSTYITHLRYNRIREEAYNALQALGVAVDRPKSQDPEGEDAQTVAITWEHPDSANFARLSSYPNLQDVYLTGQRLSDSDWAAVGRLKAVERLGLDGTNIDDKSLTQISGMDSLIYLSLRNTTITDGGLLTLANFKNLRMIDVGPEITDRGIEALHKLRHRIQVRKDEFGFLMPLHLRRIDLSTWSAMNLLPDGASYRQRLALRGFALTYPSSREAEILAALQKHLPSLGWKATATGFERDTRPIVVDSKRCVVDKVFLHPVQGAFADLHIQAGESCVVVTTNRMPPK